MDNAGIYYDNEKFDAVWKRVMNEPEDGSRKVNASGSAGTDADEAAQLQAFMNDEACDAQFYATLAGLAPSGAKNALCRIACDEKGHLKRLRAHYYLLTGETYTPPGACPLIYRIPEALRQKYAGEAAGAKAYMEAAARTGNEELGETYRALGADEARHRKIIGCLIEYFI
jgi:rubrerythrin